MEGVTGRVTPVWALAPYLSTRAYNGLRRGGYTSVEQVAAATDGELLDLRSLGPRSLAGIRAAVTKALTEPFPDEPAAGDWTTSPDGRSNSSDLYRDIVTEVDRIIRDSASALIGGRSQAVAGLIVSQLAHRWAMAPGVGRPHSPHRGSDVEAWIKRARDECTHQPGADAWYGAYDSLLDDYRDHADTGTPLDLVVDGPYAEESLPVCGAVYADPGRPDLPPQDPCRKPAGHENGPDTDWKRGFHSNGSLKWAVEAPQ